MEYYSKKIRTIEKETSEIEYIRCDKCKNKINQNEKFYKVTTFYSNADSFKHFDICENCINYFTKEYFDEISTYGTESLEIESTRYMSHDLNYRDKYDFFDSETELIENDKRN